MRKAIRTSDGWIDIGLRSCLFLLVDFLVKIWRLNECPHLKPPLPVRLKRLAAPRLVFILGICLLQRIIKKSLRKTWQGKMHGLERLAARWFCQRATATSCAVRLKAACRLYFFFLGAMTMTICRPSNLGNCSTMAISSKSFSIRFSWSMPKSLWAISRPR